MTELWAHVLMPDDVPSPNSRSAVFLVAQQLVLARRARGLAAAVVASGSRVSDEDVPVLPVLRGGARHDRLARALNLAEGRLTGRRATFARAYQGLESLDAEVTLIHNRPEGLLAVPPGSVRALYLHNDVLRRYSRRELAALPARVDVVVCVSQALADTLPDSLRAPLGVVLNGVDSELFAPRPDDRPADVPTILYCGRIVPEKGVHLLIEALAGLRHLPFRLRVVGAGGWNGDATRFEGVVRRSVAQLGLGDRVTFDRALARADIPEVMRSSDIAVVPSTWPDPCPLALLEEMSSGLAVIAARTGGIPELGRDACHYHEPGDVGGLRDALELLLRDADLRRSLGQAARRRAVERSWATVETDLVQAVTGVPA